MGVSSLKVTSLATLQPPTRELFLIASLYRRTKQIVLSRLTPLTILEANTLKQCLRVGRCLSWQAAVHASGCSSGDPFLAKALPDLLRWQGEKKGSQKYAQAVHRSWLKLLPVYCALKRYDRLGFIYLTLRVKWEGCLHVQLYSQRSYRIETERGELCSYDCGRALRFAVHWLKGNPREPYPDLLTPNPNWLVE